jgi:hypothetical protein
LKVTFDVKYGRNKIDVPLTERVYRADDTKEKDIFSQKVTIYNDVPADGVNERQFRRFVIDKCSIQGGIMQNANGTIESVVNAQTIISMDIEHYKTPLEYYALPVDVKSSFYTAKVNDFVVLAEVDDVITTPFEFQALQKKYKDNGFSITAVNENIYGTEVDNIQIIHA